MGGSGYDDEDRLVNWERADSNLDQSWDLSLVGDWDSFTENTNVQNRTHGPTHEMLTVASETVQHDVKGNMTLIPAVLRPGSDPLALTWDFDNRLVSADVDDDSVADVTYQWDALGRRVGRDDGTTATVYVQNGQQTFADYTAGTVAGSPTYNYVFASYIDEPVVRDGSGGLRYYHRNQQYSITALTGASGTITEQYSYTAYGQPTYFDGSGTVMSASAENNRMMYTGREWDDGFGLYHYRARMYDAMSGRFLGRDPIGYLDGTSLYRYVNSMPTRRVDYSGQGGEDVCVGLLNCDPADPTRPIVPLTPPAPPVRGPTPFSGPMVLCGTVTLGCRSGPVEVPVYGNSRRARRILELDENGTGDGCVTLPGGIECTTDCEGIKEMPASNGKGGRVLILEHEGCHACLMKDFLRPRKSCLRELISWLPYLGSAGASPDGCVGNEVPARPNW